MSKEDSVPFIILASFSNLISSNIYNTFVRLLFVGKEIFQHQRRNVISERDCATWFFFLRAFATNRKNEKCSPQLEFIVTVYVG